MGAQIIAEFVNREIGIDDAHYDAYCKQQQYDFCAVVNEKIDGTSNF
jgi:hypothetical protein